MDLKLPTKQPEMQNGTELAVDTLFIAASCAGRPNVLEWCPNTGLIVFAAKCDICVAALDKNTHFHRIVATQSAHSEQIVSLKLAKCFGDPKPTTEPIDVFCTATSSGEFAIWSANSGGIVERKHHFTPNPICSVNHSLAQCFQIASNSNSGRSQFLAVSAELNGLHLGIFTGPAGEQQQFHALPTLKCAQPNAFVLSFDFEVLFGGHLLLLAAGLSNGSIAFYYSEKDELGPFQLGLTLPVDQKYMWNRALKFKENGDHLLLLSATDNFVKIWKLEGSGTRNEEMQNKTSKDDQFQLKPMEFTTADQQLTIGITLESVLTVHEGFIHSLQWHPRRCDEFLSAGSDRNVVRWRFSEPDQLWLPISRLGEIGSGEEGVDYFDATFAPNGTQILYHNLFGALYLWGIQGENIYPMAHTIGGHFDSVSDICWDPSGAYLLSCSLDKTTRLCTQMKDGIFLEIARPQIHGHSMNCIASVSSSIFVSGGEEKIFRVFQANSAFAKNMAQLADVKFESAENLPSVAYQTELSLTNKAAAIADDLDGEENEFLQIFSEPPREDQLAKQTLFPELQKLYGHGYEVFAVAANHAGTLVATTCKASHPEHAAILLWDCAEWQLRKSLEAHQLTVTQLAFSKCDRFLLSTSRDRTWTLFLRTSTAPFDYSLFQRTTPKSSKHSRIIWACGWSADSRLFGTASRDKTLNIWAMESGEDGNDVGGSAEGAVVQHVCSFGAEDALTAVDFAPGKLDRSSYLLAAGLDNGKILVLKLTLASNTIDSPPCCQVLKEFSTNFAHSKTVTRLRFRPKSIEAKEESNDQQQQFELASSDANNIVKIYRLTFVR